MIRILFVILLVLSNLSFADDRPTQVKITKFIFVVPVYRELYNQNIATLIDAIYRQKLDGLPFDKVDVWFIVNNTTNVDEDVRIENQETVQYLKELSQGRTAVVRPEHKILADIAKRPISQRMNIHVLDQTTPGFKERNIGKVRDLAVKEALKTLTEIEHDKTIIAQMDADTAFNPDYVRAVVSAFEEDNLKFALMNMVYDDQYNSEERVYQRKITQDYRAAAYAFRLAYDKAMPAGGGPRIATIAKAMVEVGGVPHSTWGEDTNLITNLKKHFPKGGRFLNVEVRAKYRARPDGYDAAIYLNDLGKPIEFGEWERSTTKLLEEVEARIRANPAMKIMYDQAYNVTMQINFLKTQKLRSIVMLLLDDLYQDQQSVEPSRDFPALLNNQWFIDLLKAELKQHGPDVAKILADLIVKFPYYFSDPPMAETLMMARMQAATYTLLNERYLNSDTSNLYFLNRATPTVVQEILKQNMATLTEAWDHYQRDMKRFETWSKNRRPCSRCGRFHSHIDDPKEPKDQVYELLDRVAKLVETTTALPEYESRYKPLISNLLQKLSADLEGRHSNGAKFLYIYRDAKIDFEPSILKNAIMDWVNYFSKYTLPQLESNKKKNQIHRGDVTMNVSIIERFIAIGRSGMVKLSNDELIKMMEPLIAQFEKVINLKVLGYSDKIDINRFYELKKQLADPNYPACEVIFN